MEIQITKRQRAFIEADAAEVLFGGAAGGGKSHGQIVDALIYALRYSHSRQLLLRRTYPELEMSLVRTALALYPRELYSYAASRRMGRFANGSTLDFGYCDSERDVYRYQSAEYDVIRFDELTHFTFGMYRYLLSRLRGTRGYPKQVKSTTNPGGLGHAWVKDRFIDLGPPDTVYRTPGGSRVYLPSRVQDNGFLMRSDPDYVTRLQNLSERDRRALLEGDWDIFDGQYFSEFSRAVHIVEPFPIPGHWRRYRTLDYGLDMLACYWIAVDGQGYAYVYRELYQSGLIVSAAAEAILARTDERIHATFAPPDLWNRNRDTGRSTAEIFHKSGLPLTRADNDRVQGWYDLKEWLRPLRDEQGRAAAGLRIFPGCVNLIRTLPALQVDGQNPNDTAIHPHELTHAPDALRYFAAGRPAPGRRPPSQRLFQFRSERPKSDPLGRGERTRII